MNTTQKMNKSLTPSKATSYFCKTQVDKYLMIAQWHLDRGLSAINFHLIACSYQRLAIQMRIDNAEVTA